MMPFVQLTPDDEKNIIYRDRYVSEIDKARQKNHNWYYPRELPSPKVYWDRERDLALLFLHNVVAAPFEDHPAAYALFTPSGIVLFQSDTEGLFCNYEVKQAGTLYPVLPYELPVSLRGKDVEVRQWITEGLTCLGRGESNQFLTYTQIEVTFDQQYKPRNFETYW